MKSKKIIQIPDKPDIFYEKIIADDSTFNMYLFMIELIEYLRSHCGENGNWKLLPPPDMESLSRLCNSPLSPYEWKIVIELQATIVKYQNLANSQLQSGMRKSSK